MTASKARSGTVLAELQLTPSLAGAAGPASDVSHARDWTAVIAIV